MLQQTITSPHRVAIAYRQIDELALDPKNPRLHTPRQVSQIARSVRIRSASTYPFWWMQTKRS